MEKKRTKGIRLIASILLFGVLLYFMLGQLLLPSDRPEDTYINGVYEGRWEQVLSSGERKPISVPGTCDAKKNETVMIETQLPDNTGELYYLCFRSAKQDMEIYIDGVLRQSYSTEGKRLFGKLSAVAYVFVQIDEADAGKILRLVTKTDSSYSGIFYTVYYGNPMGIWHFFFEQYGLELIVAFVTLILSLVVIIGSLAFRISYHRRIPLEYLGWGILIAAVWLITNSTFRQLIFPNLTIVNDMTFLMIMLLALPYLLYMNEIQKGRYNIVYTGLEGIVIINFVVCCILHITKICDFTDTIGYVASFCILSIVWLLVSIILDIVKKKVREYIFVAAGMFAVCVAAFIQIIIYFHRENSFNGVILAIGLIVLLVFSTVNTIYEIVGMDREKQQALMASESKGRFLAHMSHEIRTPIHAVLGMDEMILRESKDAKIRGYAMDIQNAGQTLLALINDILDISKIESGKLEIIPVDYDFSSLVHDVVNMMQMKARDKELEFLLTVDETIPARLYGDDVRLRQILVNLLSNAIKYTEQGSVALKISAKQTEEYADILFSVEDTGIGIRKEDMEKLFGEFERIEEERNRKIEGTGLGMSITMQLLDMMDSKLEVESTYGKGSRFFFTVRQQIRSEVPVGNLEQRIHNQAEQSRYEAMFTAPEARILIVDDNAVNRKVLTNLLKATKIQIEEASSGMQCLELVQETKYDIIFMDHMMPEMDGIEALHKMKCMEAHKNMQTPVVALTANAVTGAREMYLQEGFCDFLSKPVNPEKMERLIMELLPEALVLHDRAIPDESEAKRLPQADWETLPEIDGIDWEYGKMHCSQLEILFDTMAQFYTTAEIEAKRLMDMLSDLNQAVAQQENPGAFFKAYRIQVHAMKSAAAMIGAVGLSGVAKMLEYAARDEKIEPINDMTAYFVSDWQGMKEKLRVLDFAVEPDMEGCEPDVALCHSLLSMLTEAIEAMDVDTADAIIAQLKQYRYPTETMQTVFTQLCAAVSNLEEAETAACCKKLQEELGSMETENKIEG